MTRKKKILFVTEASFLYTGYSVYAREILKRLYATEKYELAEFASYAKMNDERMTGHDIPWLFYPNEVDKNDSRYDDYNSNPINQFGSWRFEKVVLDFKPDVIASFRDVWMDGFISQSPLRNYYQWIYMPTVDSIPSRPEWLDQYINADAILTYSDWAGKELVRETNGKINYLGSAPPAVDLDIFAPVEDKNEHRRKLGFFEDGFIIGTVMRNQRRKLFDDLFQAFNIFLQKCRDSGNDELARKTFLYVHTSYPDNSGWDIPRLLAENGVLRKVVFTYICQSCRRPFASFFQDGRTVCVHCGEVSAVLPNVQRGLTTEHLAEIYKIFDLYVQYSICEGFGIGQVEAASCGVPIMSVDYSAMSDVVRKLNGQPIKVAKMFRELATHCYRAYPDNEHCAELFYKFFTKQESVRKRNGEQARKGVEEHYSWDKSAKMWSDYFDSVEVEDKWEEPPKLFTPNYNVPSNLSNKDFRNWCLINILNEPQKIYQYFGMELLRDLNYGVVIQNKKLHPLTRDSVITKLRHMAEQKNLCERARCGILNVKKDDFIQSARKRIAQ